LTILEKGEEELTINRRR